MNNDKTDFTQGSILKKLCLFMLPILGALVLQAAYGAVDLLVVGRFGSTSGLSGVSTGSQLLNLVTFVVTQLAMGVTVLIARYLGKKKPERIGAVLGGAALATVLAQGVSVAFALVILTKKDLPFSVKKTDIRFNPQCRRFLSIGLPLALQEFLTQLSFLALCAFVNRLGLAASSGYGVASKIVNFAMLIPSSLMQSMASFVAQNVGAGNQKRARKTMLTGIGVGLAFGIAVFTFIMLRGDLLAGIFSTDPDVVEKGFEYLKGFAPETILTAVLFSMIGYFNGNNKTVWVMTQGLIQTLCVRLPVAYFMSSRPDASLTMIGLAAPISTLVGVILNTGFYIHMNKTSASLPDGQGRE